MKSNMIFSSNRRSALFYAKLLQFQGAGSLYKDLSTVLGNDFIKTKTIIWLGSVENSSISGFGELAKNWDNLRYKKIIFVLVGDAPQNHEIYKQVWSVLTTPAMQEKINFFSLMDLSPRFKNNLMQKVSDWLIPVHCLLNKQLQSSTLNIRQCVELIT